MRTKIRQAWHLSLITEFVRVQSKSSSELFLVEFLDRSDPVHMDEENHASELVDTGLTR
jgi:hypothetical protein